jgi:hypothetical protein
MIAPHSKTTAGKVSEWVYAGLAVAFLCIISLYAAVTLLPFLLLLFVPVILLVTWRSWLLHPGRTWKWIREEVRKTFRPTPEEAEQQRIDSEIRQKADELASWESRGASDAKTKPVGGWQPPHGAACRCDLCTAYWRGLKTRL